MEDGHRKQETDHLLEDGCFLGKSLSKEEVLRGKSKVNMYSSESKACSLLRAPSLPPNLGIVEEEGEEEEEDEDGPRMGDLIRQAMPCKLERAPSFPTFRTSNKVVAPADVGIPRGPTINKLTRRSSMDPSFIWPPKLSSKSKGSSASSTPKDHHQKRSEMLARNMGTASRASKPRNLERSMSLKGLSDKEVIGFQELGFTFDKEDLNSSVAAKLASLETKGSTYMEGKMSGKGKRSPLSEAGNATDGSNSPPIAKLVGTKSSAEDMKAQIKFWARAVASNVQPE